MNRSTPANQASILAGLGEGYLNIIYSFDNYLAAIVNSITSFAIISYILISIYTQCGRSVTRRWQPRLYISTIVTYNMNIHVCMPCLCNFRNLMAYLLSSPGQHAGKQLHNWTGDIDPTPENDLRWKEEVRQQQFHVQLEGARASTGLTLCVVVSSGEWYKRT